jgi:hypothetical protein
LAINAAPLPANPHLLDKMLYKVVDDLATAGSDGQP